MIFMSEQSKQGSKELDVIRKFDNSLSKILWSEIVTQNKSESFSETRQFKKA